jgi:two-component system sporulation sensor kinase B
MNMAWYLITSGNFMFLMASAALIIISILVIILNPKEEANRWGSACIFINGVVFSLDYFKLHSYSSIYFIFYPYTLLMFSMSYTRIYFVPANWKKNIAWIGLIPPAILFAINLLFPAVTFAFPYFPFWVLSFLTANFLLIYSYCTTKNPEIKRDKFLTCVIVVPITLIDLIYNTFHDLIKKQVLNFELYQILVFVAIFISILIKYGILGVKFRLEKSRLNSTIQAMTSGTSFLSHTIKNEIQNIWACIDKIESYTGQSQQGLQDNLHFIRNSTNHLLAMVSRINDQMQEIVFREMRIRLIDIIEQSLNLITPLLQAKHIKVIKEYAVDVHLMFDPIHLQEVLNNIFKNAIEAMDTGDILSIHISRTNKWLVLAVKDTGVGISKDNLPLVFNPFFSTKNQKVNFGLGLSYCYNVMHQYGGLIEIYSEENKGTTVFLNFKLQKVMTRFKKYSPSIKSISITQQE